jgi:Domain of unknown function (DUF1864)
MRCMQPSLDAFDTWIRGRFKDLNTELEDIYIALADPAAVEGVAPERKAALCDEGNGLIAEIAALPVLELDERGGYDLLGSLGLFMAALRRHELTNPDREERSPFPEASALAQRLASGLGVAPRFATAHVNLSNVARMGVHKSFTWLPDELTFIEYNCHGILSTIRAADVLRRIPALGVTHRVSLALFHDAERALEDVFRSNAELNERLDVRRFFYSVRPYFKPYRVGRHEYRGANAGDFAGINEVDLMLGLCRVADPAYAALVLEKQLYMTADDQRLLRECVRRPSLLDEWLAVIEQGPLSEPVAENLRAYIAVCEAHGRTAAQHHDLFVRRFIEQPSADVDPRHLKQITASGPPLAVLLASLEALRDKRLAAPREDGVETRYLEMQRLRAACGASLT